MRCTAIYRYGYEEGEVANELGLLPAKRFPNEGSCFLTEHGVVTCAHVVKEAGDLVAVEGGGEGNVVRVDYGKHRDLAVCAVPHTGGLEVLPLATETPKVGDLLTWVGTDDNWREEWARVATISVSPAWIITSYPGGRMTYGDSGGPLLNERGDVVGVTVAMGKSRSWARFQALDAIRAFLGQVR